MQEKKVDLILREAILIVSFFMVFPFQTIRALAFKWMKWLQKVDAEIKQDHKDYNKFMGYENNQ